MSIKSKVATYQPTDRQIVRSRMWGAELIAGAIKTCSLQAPHFQLAWVSSPSADRTGSEPALFQGFYQPYRGDTGATAADNLKSAIRQVAEGECLLFILPVDCSSTCLPVPSALSQLAILSVSLSLVDFLSRWLRLAAFLRPLSPFLSQRQPLISPVPAQR